MRLAIIGDELDQNLGRVIDAVSTNEFHGIEVRSVWNTQPDKLTDTQLIMIHDSIKKAGLTISGFDSPCLKTPLPRTNVELETSRNSIMHAINQARILDAGFVRIFTFYHEGEPNPILAAKAAAPILDGIIPDDIKIYVETGMRTNTPTMKHMLQFLEVIGDDRLGVVWDPGNTIFSGVGRKPFPNDYQAGKTLIKHVHIKDPVGQKEYTRLGDGDLPWPEIIYTLKNDGYQGYISLETHWRMGRVLSQYQRDNPWFDSFSANGYEASLECMQRLLNYVRVI
ncbi:sugar phosphate isomerase/epimerase [Paenibacillus sp. MZ04-78.2]|uniref:sugar phosphate isomerase/epimerase family protein n=1 Tax=Paenibacillus sp. MZ04-78.2 TaxID=2962034 RepID=UPI0020B8E0DE|nr:sugar phosphate isomerase/epimerase family protein [Paenibacillus sp. MZ04-78.2]MCP3776519.1 sugar phosphate isomerase/epimerase [Paenibacillus sp. MZ04-78.2]